MSSEGYCRALDGALRNPPWHAGGNGLCASRFRPASRSKNQATSVTAGAGARRRESGLQHLLCALLSPWLWFDCARCRQLSGVEGRANAVDARVQSSVSRPSG